MDIKALHETDLSTFREQGSTVVRGLMDADTCHQALEHLDTLDQQPEILPSYEPEYEPSSAGSRRLRKIRRLIWTEPRFWGDVLRRANAERVAEEVIGPHAAIVFNAAFLKPAEVGTEVALHQDQALWSREYPGAFSVWYALSPVTERNGCLIGCPRSHLRGLIQHRNRGAYPWHPSLDAGEDRLPRPIRMPLAPGDAAMWDRYFVHGSEPNQSRMDRRGMVVVFANSAYPGFNPVDCFMVRDLAGL